MSTLSASTYSPKCCDTKIANERRPVKANETLYLTWLDRSFKTEVSEVIRNYEGWKGRIDLQRPSVWYLPK